MKSMRSGGKVAAGGNGGAPREEVAPGEGRGGFLVPPMPWPVGRARREGWYFYAPAMGRGGGPSRVQVEPHGEMLMLGSYSYLGLIGHPDIERAAIEAIRRWGTGTHGVRLLAGTLPIHAELEESVARLKGCEAAAVFSSGFLANVSVVTALVGRGDIVLTDKLDHASIVDGCRLSGATVVRLAHNDMADLERKLAQADPWRNRLVIADAVFSMDGDIYDLPAAARICRRHGALLMLDEAHSLGVLGRTGLGIEEHFGLGPESYDIKMGTFSKAIPSCGGYVAASREIVEVIQHLGRGYVYSAALPPAQAAAALESLAVLRREPWRVAALQANIAIFRAQLARRGIRGEGAGTPIVPVICGEDETAFAVARECQLRGVFVQAIPWPVVPRGRARLRCCVTAAHTAEQLARAAEVVAAACRLHGALAVEEAAPERREAGRDG